MIEFRVFIGSEDHRPRFLRMPTAFFIEGLIHFLHQPRHCQSRNVTRAWDMSPYFHTITRPSAKEVAF